MVGQTHLYLETVQIRKLFIRKEFYEGDCIARIMVDISRTLIVGGVLFAVIVGGLVFSFAYPFSTNDYANPQGTYVTPSFTEPYEITETVTITEVSDERSVYHQQRTLVVEEMELLEVHRYTDTKRDRVIDTIHFVDTDDEWRTTHRQTDEEGTMESWVEHAAEDEIVSQADDGSKYTLITASDDEGTVSDHLQNFYQYPFTGWKHYGPDYERQGETTYETRDVTVYEPDDGWYERAGRGAYSEFRVIDSDGELYVDAETGVIVYADVSYTIVEASHYAEYLQARLTGESATIEFQYEFSEGGAVTVPDWAEEPP